MWDPNVRLVQCVACIQCPARSGFLSITVGMWGVMGGGGELQLKKKSLSVHCVAIVHGKADLIHERRKTHETPSNGTMQ